MSIKCVDVNVGTDESAVKSPTLVDHLGWVISAVLDPLCCLLQPTVQRIKSLLKNASRLQDNQANDHKKKQCQLAWAGPILTPALSIA